MLTPNQTNALRGVNALFRSSRHSALSSKEAEGLRYAASVLLEHVMHHDPEGSALDDVLDQSTTALTDEGYRLEVVRSWLDAAVRVAWVTVRRERGES